MLNEKWPLLVLKFYIVDTSHTAIFKIVVPETISYEKVQNFSLNKQLGHLT